MGSTMKKSIFDEQTNKALKKWQKNAAAKKKNDGKPAAKASVDSVTKAPQKAEMEKGPSTPEQTANIMASVDIQGNTKDLLTGGP